MTRFSRILRAGGEIDPDAVVQAIRKDLDPNRIPRGPIVHREDLALELGLELERMKIDRGEVLVTAERVINHALRTNDGRAIVDSLQLAECRDGLLLCRSIDDEGSAHTALEMAYAAMLRDRAGRLPAPLVSALCV